MKILARKADSVPAEPVMYFGIGAEKAATSWLADYLGQHPQVGGGRLKGYRYFTQIYPTGAGEKHDIRPKGVPSALLPYLARYRVRKRASRRRGLGRYVYSLVPKSYKALVRGDGGPCRAFGDMTPAYSLLTAEGYGAMRATHPRTRFFFVMRDPVARLWSSIRMDFGKGRQIAALDEAELLKWLDTLPENFQYFGFSDYARTITELERAVPADDILYLFYEDLFTDASIRRLTDLLGLDYHPFSAEKVHAGDSKPMTEAWKWRAREVLDPIYRFVQAKFGDQVPEKWLLGRGAGTGATGHPARAASAEHAPLGERATGFVGGGNA